MIDIFAALGNSLTINASERMIEQAISLNSWFTSSYINLAIKAICETMLQRERVDEWLSHYNTPANRAERVLIVMAGNIPLVGFFDLLCVLAAGHTPIVKPSHKDRVLMEWVIAELKRIEPSLPIYICSGTEYVDRVIATGSDSTRRHFESLYPNIPTLLRGTRHSIAILESEEFDTKALQEDIYSYSGLGCRNVSMIFAPKEFNLDRLPRGYDDPKLRGSYLRLRALLTMQGVEFVDNGSLCIIESESYPSDIAQLSIVRYESIDQVQRWIEQHDEEIQCIASESRSIEHPRQVKIGETQHPTLHDYADGVDTMTFLLSH